MKTPWSRPQAGRARPALGGDLTPAEGTLKPAAAASSRGRLLGECAVVAVVAVAAGVSWGPALALVVIVAGGVALGVVQLRRRPSADAGAPRSRGWTGTSSALARGIRVGAVLAILAGPAALVLAARPAPAASVAPVAGDSPDRIARQSAAADGATQWVRAWLSTPAANTAALASFWPTGQLQLPAVAAVVDGAVPASVAPTAPGVWLVTVAADVKVGKGPVRHRYFQVSMGVAGGVGTAATQPLTVPSEVPGPGGSVPVSISYPVAVPATSPAAVAVQGFLAALLTGTGDLTRWTSPGAPLVALDPAPYSAVELTAVAASGTAAGLTDTTAAPTDGTTVHVLVTAQASTTANPGDGITCQYLLQVRARGGRWEVAGIDQAPQMSDPSTPTPTPTP